jgi:hypothetical protein
MAKVKTRTRVNNRNSNNGGIMGSGIFGHFGSLVNCDANDDSAFCTLSKLVSTIMMLLFLAALFYLIYYVIKIGLFKNGSGGGSGSGSGSGYNLSRK